MGQIHKYKYKYLYPSSSFPMLNASFQLEVLIPQFLLSSFSHHKHSTLIASQPMLSNIAAKYSNERKRNSISLLSLLYNVSSSMEMMMIFDFTILIKFNFLSTTTFITVVFVKYVSVYHTRSI